MDISRREFLTGAAATVGGSAVISTRARAAEDYQDSIPEDVYLVYDEPTLTQLEPFVVTRTLNVLPSDIVGVIATTGSENLQETGDEDTNIAEFWFEYPVQEGYTPFESHLGDHEPVYVEYKPGPSGPELVRVIASVYHWIVGKTTTPTIASESSGYSRPTLRAADKYHHFFSTEEVGDLVSEDTGISDLRNHLQGWLDNGWEVHVPTVTNPWVMRNRSSWWANTVGDFRVAEAFYSAMLAAGFYGADQSGL